jgi:hypothetical protein
VEDKFQDILSKVIKKLGRSRLEPYGDLIDELRSRGLTYRDIADILTDEFQFQVPKSTVNDFVRERSLRRRNAARRMSRRVATPNPIGPMLQFCIPARDRARTMSGKESQPRRLVKPGHTFHLTMTSTSTQLNRCGS